MLLLFATGLFAGTIDAIAGGGGLISLPMLLSTGIPPQIAFGTNKLQSIVGTFTAVKRYHQQGLISREKILTGILFGLFGSASGSIAAQLISNQVLHKIIPLLLLVVFLYTVSSPKLGVEDKHPRMKEIWFYMIFGFALAFYDGFFGPGVGSLWVFFLTYFLGFNLIKATAYTKVFNLNSSTVAMICFVIGGNVDYHIAACMAVGQFIGGRLGASLAIKQGVKLIRPIFLTVVMYAISVLIYRSYANSDALLQVMLQYGIAPQIVIGISILTSVLFIYRRRRSQLK